MRLAPILPTLCALVASLLAPGIASSSTATTSETRVWAFDLADGTYVGVERSLTHELQLGCDLACDDLASDSLLAAKGGGTVTKTRATPGRDGGTSSITLEKDVVGRTVSRTHTVTKDGQVIHQHQEHIGRYGSERRFPDGWTGTPTINAPPHTPKPPSFPPGSN